MLRGRRRLLWSTRTLRDERASDAMGVGRQRISVGLVELAQQGREIDGRNQIRKRGETSAIDAGGDGGGHGRMDLFASQTDRTGLQSVSPRVVVERVEYLTAVHVVLDFAVD